MIQELPGWDLGGREGDTRVTRVRQELPGWERE